MTTTIQCKPFGYRRAWIRTDAVFGCRRPVSEATNAADFVDWLTKYNCSGTLVGFRSVDALDTLTMPVRPSMRRDRQVGRDSSKPQTDWMSP